VGTRTDDEGRGFKERATVGGVNNNLMPLTTETLGGRWAEGSTQRWDPGALWQSRNREGVRGVKGGAGSGITQRELGFLANVGGGTRPRLICQHRRKTLGQTVMNGSGNIEEARDLDLIRHIGKGG